MATSIVGVCPCTDEEEFPTLRFVGALPGEFELPKGMGSGALSGPALCAQYNYDAIHSTNLSLSLNVIRNAGPDNASG